MKDAPGCAIRVSAMDAQLDALRAVFASMPSALVCFSGGIDSALVLKVAHEVLGDRCLAMTALSPALPLAERDEAAAYAKALGVPHVLVESHEIDDPNYVANATNRCYFCKSELYRIARREADARGFAVVCNGTNLDDLGDHRPGLKAADEGGVRAPLVEAAMRKDDVRRVAKALAMPLWDKPAAACLASRIPYGTSVSQQKLRQIDLAESAIKALGFRQVRVRYHGDVARIEVGSGEIDAAFAQRQALSAACKAAGFGFATLDLDGYRMGSHNEVVKLRVLNA
ncbi:MAG: ATP-dependent sacrificial sulfur transferase LarE [Myxococcales bacterium]|nr:ATP-dependent sacrificial sulfur transferase LarE [Myxococcales bacterium]